jgi:hypothetical protein
MTTSANKLPGIPSRLDALGLNVGLRQPPVQHHVFPFPEAFDPELPTAHDIPQHAPGAKLDKGKPRVGLVLGDFARALIEVSKVGTVGAQKYTEHGWLSVPDGVARYTDALYRHLLAENREELDPELELPHAACVAWNALARLEMMLRSQENA